MIKINKDFALKYFATFYCAILLRTICGPIDVMDVLIIATCSLLAQWLLEKIFKR